MNFNLRKGKRERVNLTFKSINIVVILLTVPLNLSLILISFLRTGWDGCRYPIMKYDDNLLSVFLRPLQLGDQIDL